MKQPNIWMSIECYCVAMKFTYIEYLNFLRKEKFDHTSLSLVSYNEVRKIYFRELENNKK